MRSIVVAKFTALLRAFAAEKQGNVAVIFTVALLPIVSSVGAAVDFSHANSIRTGLQAAADATALMVVRNATTTSVSELESKATSYFKAQFNRSRAHEVQVAFSYDEVSAPTVKVAGSALMYTEFLGIVGVPSVNLVARAAAMATDGADGCILALNSKVSGAVTAQGNSNISLQGCSLYDNSSSNTALKVGGSARISALSVNVVGEISGVEKITTTHGTSTGQPPMKDPYATTEIPSFTGCNENNFTAKFTITIKPGVYCGGMKINAGANVTLQRGIYYIDQGSFTVNGGATVTGQDVTLVFTSSTLTNWASATINGGATINLTAPRDGDLKGIVVFGDRRMPVDTEFKFNGGSTQYFGGVVYLPKATAHFTGGAKSDTSCTKLIVDTVTFGGNSNFAMDCKEYATKSFGSPHVRLTM